jgi:hypothetical protein
MVSRELAVYFVTLLPRRYDKLVHSGVIGTESA